HPFTLVCGTPEGTFAARDALGPAFDDRRAIGLWWWEVDRLRGRWLRAFDGLDEVWAGSAYVADLLAPVSPVPVLRMPLPVSTPRAADLPRGALGLPDGFTFGFVFDHASTLGRKNPLGLIEAFSRAFPPGEPGDEHLVLKTLGGDRHPDAHARVLAAAARHPRVTVIDRHLDVEEKNALIERLDAYVSLHRAEGFGLTIAEAMLLGTPVIATDYGGSRDFVTSFNGWPVDFKLAPVGPGNDPYPADGEWAEPDLEHAAAVLREVAARPEEAARRAERAAAEVAHAHAPARVGALMVQRLRTLSGLGAARDGRVEPLDLVALADRVRTGPRTGDDARGRLRDAVLRVLRPYTVHQRLVDEELLRALRTLDERVRGVAAGQSSLAAELRDRTPGGPGEAAVPPSSDA
ncbi:MAG TPA: glycosyltransferase, partial [Solirubrobacteraceae bacterium]|nr:glycosyltransferase [Solirubrobacteraceae bacterium]